MIWLDRLKGWIKWTLCAVVYRCVPRHAPEISPASTGVNLMGYAQAEMGLGEALRNTAMALKNARIPFLVRKLNVPLLNRQDNLSMQPFIADYCRYGINCIAINPDLLYRLPQWLPYAEWGRRYNVGYWFWELEHFPKAWRYTCHLVDEVWVNTDFVADVVRQAHPRVYKIPFAVEFETPSADLYRAYFGLPQDAFLVLFSYDFNSSSARKNPQAVIEAFRLAFPDQDAHVALAVKSINGDRAPAWLNEVKATLQSDPRIIWIDHYLSTEVMRGLLRLADCFLSLHRAEGLGLGLGLAESIYLGKLVIGTAYSGNMEFMNDTNAYLVPYKMVDVQSGEYHFSAGQQWAKPDIQSAAQLMRRVFSDPQSREAIGHAARLHMQKHHSLTVVSRALASRTNQFGQALQLLGASA